MMPHAKPHVPWSDFRHSTPLADLRTLFIRFQAHGYPPGPFIRLHPMAAAQMACNANPADLMGRRQAWSGNMVDQVASFSEINEILRRECLPILRLDERLKSTEVILGSWPEFARFG